MRGMAAAAGAIVALAMTAAPAMAGGAFGVHVGAVDVPRSGSNFTMKIAFSNRTPKPVSFDFGNVRLQWALSGGGEASEEAGGLKIDSRGSKKDTYNSVSATVAPGSSLVLTFLFEDPNIPDGTTPPPKAGGVTLSVMLNNMATVTVPSGLGRAKLSAMLRAFHASTAKSKGTAKGKGTSKGKATKKATGTSHKGK